jgi:predicted unusual protein kinase regulating ubiquinone biosynthesis (AarF/ABC1/UbiB family)
MLGPGEMEEFALCLEEQIDYEEEGEEEEEGSEHCHMETKLPSIKTEVYTPKVTINEFFEGI